MNEMDDKTLRLELESRGHSIGPIVGQIFLFINISIIY